MASSGRESVSSWEATEEEAGGRKAVAGEAPSQTLREEEGSGGLPCEYHRAVKGICRQRE